MKQSTKYSIFFYAFPFFFFNSSYRTTSSSLYLFRSAFKIQATQDIIMETGHPFEPMGNEKILFPGPDTAVTAAHLESPHSPLRFHSPQLHFERDLPDTPPYASPAASPETAHPATSMPPTVDRHTQCSIIPSPSPCPDGWRTRGDVNFTASDPPSVTVISKAVRQEGLPALSKLQDRLPTPAAAVLKRSRNWATLQRVSLGFRVWEFVFCLVAFSVMAADKTQGWSGDSFYRYKEYRYCVAMNVIAFVYSGFQACDLAYHLMIGKPIILRNFRCYFDFFMDQVLAYLLMSASSSAATRVDDWQSNWGNDKFTKMARASVIMSFLAFVGLAMSSLVSGYFVFAQDVA
ncbi:hypothetical protein SAY87_003886 [Trapa incisa]|uniref:CASP-like protein n=1 Tax=Trapa incisa TaxID=236973 RepID=A0AAN7JN75_9MYRT|nr:hypothetical protein SAY87_003886 [Trapa incisa]